MAQSRRFLEYLCSKKSTTSVIGGVVRRRSSPEIRCNASPQGGAMNATSNSSRDTETPSTESVASALNGRPSQKPGAPTMPISGPHAINGDIVFVAIAVAAVASHLPEVEDRITLRAEQEQLTVIQRGLILHQLLHDSTCYDTPRKRLRRRRVIHRSARGTDLPTFGLRPTRRPFLSTVGAWASFERELQCSSSRWRPPLPGRNV